MALLQDKKYSEARILCAKKLTHVIKDDKTRELDFYGSVDEHFLLLDTLVCKTNINPIYEETFK